MEKHKKPLKIKGDGYGKKNGYGKKPETQGPAEAEPKKNRYYSAIADKIRIAKFCVIAFLALFAFGGMILNSKELNSGNFWYLLRYLNIQGPSASAKPEFYAELDETSSICYYKNNIAVLRKNRLDIYDTNGKKNFTSKLVYSNPTLKASDRYIISYDLGSEKLEIYNAFSKVYEYKGDRPIYGATVTDKGNVAYVTSEKGYASAVYVLNSSFETKFRCFFENDYIIGADIDDKAERLAVAGFYAMDGDYLGRIILYETNSPDPVKTIEIPGERPYGIKLCESGVFALFENSLKFYSQTGELVSQYGFDYRKIEKAELGAKFSCVVLGEKTLGIENRILIFGESGEIAYDGAIGLEIMDIKFSEDYCFLYFLARTGLYRVEIGNSEFKFLTGEYEETANRIIHANGKTVFLSGLVKINAVSLGEF
ncbi:MAG: DUF5711 family protein [Oscillospiraceae bacterium]|nr:DUF5711 family protein [Oscillospiraceae bacterium]